MELVEQRPCIWDKTANEYKDRNKKNEAWMNVYNHLTQDFHTLPEAEKLEAGYFES